MTIKTYLDRSQWADAALCASEPDFISWIDDTTQLPCAIIRVEWSGHLCGYVGVPRGQTLDLNKLQVHGGITYDQPEHPRLDWPAHDIIGFDCIHSGDRGLHRVGLPHEQYRYVGYVLTEVNNLAQQVHAQLNRLSV